MIFEHEYEFIYFILFIVFCVSAWLEYKVNKLEKRIIRLEARDEIRSEISDPVKATS
ncbi:MAG: hypothetical protein KAR35_03965 [Candidatus Heimdallarchaeota archaeon]|nr:hypothetical protein [Candidatus Heimdallarchaeota archaeon]MCK5048511.1 hypothetical protein [Candidatus Heimdallarchaeota archaeon]